MTTDGCSYLGHCMSTYGLHFVARPLQLPPSAGLEGAFRVHLDPQSLQALSLKVGEVCDIADEKGELVGRGIAWRAADKMGASPRLRGAKMSEILRDAFGLKDGLHINIAPTNAIATPAERVILIDVTPVERFNGHEREMSDGRWRNRCISALSASRLPSSKPRALDIQALFRANTDVPSIRQLRSLHCRCDV